MFPLILEDVQPLFHPRTPPPADPTLGTLSTRMSAMDETIQNTLLTLQDTMEEIRAEGLAVGRPGRQQSRGIL